MLPFLISAGYVAAVYSSSSSRRARDDPVTIRARLLVVSCYTAIVVAALPITVGDGWVQLAGLYPKDIKYTLIKTFKAISLTMILFTGPLLNGEGRIPDSNLELIRDIILGPLTEEIIYRGAVLALSRDKTLTFKLFVTPLYFSMAHVHHGFVAWRAGRPLGSVSLGVFVHALTTWLFGVYAVWVFMRTGSVWGPTIIHAFCNWQGPPSSGPTWYCIILILGLAVFAWQVPAL